MKDFFKSGFGIAIGITALIVILIIVIRAVTKPSVALSKSIAPSTQTIGANPNDASVAASNANTQTIGVVANAAANVLDTLFNNIDFGGGSSDGSGN